MKKFSWNDFDKVQELWEARREREAGEVETEDEDSNNPCSVCRKRRCEECGF